jgi:lipopolysaccharide export system protein LptA
MRWLFLFAALFLALPALAQDAGVPIGIEADELEFQQDKNLYIARGNAVVTQKGVTIKADRLTASAVEANGKTTFTKVQAEGAVHITSDMADITGQQGVYDVTREVAVLRGSNLKLTTPTDTITARDSLEFWQKQNLAVARGAAQAVRGTNKINADVLTALLEKSGKGQDVRRVGAEGNVTITTPQEVARGARGVYDVKKQLAKLDGGVKITRGENQLNGARAEVNMATGVSKILSGGGQRVKGLILPKNAPAIEPPVAKASAP